MNDYYKKHVANVHSNGWSLEYIPDHHLTTEICMAAVSNVGYAIRYVPKRLLTPEICIAAVTKTGDALKYVPEHLRTPEICMAAVASDNLFAIGYVKDEQLKQMLAALYNIDVNNTLTLLRK